ncbi:MAG: VTT domain-containing protein [Bacteroidota bacterium]
MKILVLQVVIFSSFFLLLFAFTFNINFAEQVLNAANNNLMMTAATSITLLASDIVLPVPSSVLMLLNGKLFGIVIGTIVSCLGLVLSTLLGYIIGRKIIFSLSRFLNTRQQEEAEKIFKQWGYLALIISRPIPLLSESISIVAGTQGMSLSSVCLSAFAGSLPGALLYAYYGSTSNNEQNQYIPFLLVMGIAVLAFIIAKLLKKQVSKNKYELL